MAVDVDKDILRLQVPIQDALLVNVLQPKEHLREVKFGFLLRKFLLALK